MNRTPTSSQKLLRPLIAASALLLCACTTSAPVEVDSRPVGAVDADMGARRITTAQWVRPAGPTSVFRGRPLDMVMAPDRSALFVKSSRDLIVLDPVTLDVRQKLPIENDGGSMHGIAVSPDGRQVILTTSKSSLLFATAEGGGPLKWTRRIDVPTPKKTGSNPTGLALSRDGSRMWVCRTVLNELTEIDLGTGRVTHSIPVGICPFDVVVSPDETTAWVSNFGGRRAAEGDATANTAGSKLVVDERGIGMTGTVSRIDLAKRAVVATVAVGLHPSDLLLDAPRSRLFVANANSDSISIVDTARDVTTATIAVTPDPALPFGSLVNALAQSPDGGTLYAACGGNNAVAVLDVRNGESAQVRGFIPAGWFPGSLVVDGEALLIGNVRGDGSQDPRPEDDARTSTRYRGSVTRATVGDEAALAAWTAQVHRDARIPQALAAMARGDESARPTPVPARHGEPSVFEHVVYVIKENRTYDQVFGDLPQGNAAPALCTYGREVTPNQHALAEEFALLDNYYCNGVVSADGHQWATQGIVTDYNEKNYGGWTRGYDLGTDALTYAGCDFIWDNALLHGRTFRNFGEFDFPATEPANASWFDIWRDRESAAGRIGFKHSIQLAPLARYSSPDYPGWNLRIPDQLRIDRWLAEFREAERTGEWHDLSIVYLPQDHTSGVKKTVPSPRAYVADNDLAVGRLVEAISHSRFWEKTCIFIIEDDPQDGWDHVDGHRSTCLVISPYTRRRAVIHDFYNQTAVLHTIERILGLPPMNQLNAAAPVMASCFTETPDLTAFDLRQNLIPLNETNATASAANPNAARLEEITSAMDLSVPDRIDDDDLNRILWEMAKGPAIPYPRDLAGAHGRGLGTLRLTLDRNAVRDDDDDDDDDGPKK